MLFTFRPSLTITELPCLLCARSATSVIPGIFGLAWSLGRCVSLRHRQWQCCILHNSDSMDALLADRPSPFADITVIAPEGFWLCTADMVWGIIHKFDVLEELVNNLTRWIGLVVLQGSQRARFFHDVHINNTKHITIATIYIPPRDSTSIHYKTADTDIPHSVLTGDVNAHFTLWHSYTDDHKGQLIADVISNSDHITINTNTPTRVPNTTLQKHLHQISPRCLNTLYNRTLWTTQHALSSDHLPIITTINIRHDYRLQQNRRTFTNYKKADWTQFMEDTESAFAQTTIIPTNIHTANRIFTNIILMADKHNIPKGKMHSNWRLLPEDIVCKITQRNNITRANTCDPVLKLLHTKTQTKHMEGASRRSLGPQAQHIHILWKTIHGPSNKNTSSHTQQLHYIQQQNIKHIANCFIKQLTNTVKHATHKTNRSINRAAQNIQGYNIILTTSQVQQGIKQSKNNNSQGHDKLNIRHLKHIGPLGLAFLTSMFKTALNKT